MLANHRIDDDDEHAKEEAKQATHGCRALKIRWVVGSEKRLSPRQKAPNRDARGQESGCDGGPLENHPREGKDRIHAADPAFPERTRGARNANLRRQQSDERRALTVAAQPSRRFEYDRGQFR